MVQYIDKSALVAEIERRIKEIDEIGTYLSPKGILTNLLCHLNTLEVKEVDLEKELNKLNSTLYDMDGVAIDDDTNSSETRYITVEDVKDIAKHFFELGINAQKGEQVMKANTPIDFFSVYSEEEVAEIDKRIEMKQKEYDAKLRDKMMKAKDFPMTD